MIDQLPLIFCIFVWSYIFWGKCVIKDDIINSLIFAILFSLQLHAPYISSPLYPQWAWVEALPWVGFLICIAERQIKDFIREENKEKNGEH